jgi:phage regulator Rha-like protein
MNELVFLEPNKIDAVPFTTSKVIADMTNVRHDKVKTSIVKYRSAIETFGKLTPYGDTLGGRGNESGYRLNEQQATLLITFLKNTPEVVKFKTELVRQFYAMRTELNRRHMERAELKPIRREMTDIIQQMTDNKWAYKQYTDLAYKMAVGCIASQLRKQRKADKRATAVDYMTADEIHAVTEMQYRIAVLLETGMDYYQIKAALEKRLLLKAS